MLNIVALASLHRIRCRKVEFPRTVLETVKRFYLVMPINPICFIFHPLQGDSHVALTSLRSPDGEKAILRHIALHCTCRFAGSLREQSRPSRLAGLTGRSNGVSKPNEKELAASCYY